jgi:carboxymethylenebutenolidase
MASGRTQTLRAHDDTPFDVYLSGNISGARPALMMFSPIFGVDEDIKALADRWGERGYLVAAPDYFARVEPGVIDRSEASRKHAFDRWNALGVDRAIDDMTSLRDYLLGLPDCNGKIAALGYCAGGELAFLCGTRLGAQAVATFHGTRMDRHLGEADKINRATLHFGGNDPLVPIEHVDAIRASLAGKPHVDIHVYPGVGHGFSFKGRPSYNENAATSSDHRTQEVVAQLK